MGFTFRTAAWLPLAVIALAGYYSTASAYTDITWTGGGSNLSWSTTANWNPQQQPTSGDNVFFAEAGGASPGKVTNLLSADQTVQDLSYLYTNLNLNFQTTDLGGHTLRVNGTLAVTSKSGIEGRRTAIQNGSLQIGSAGAAGNLYVSRLDGGGGFLNLTGSSVNAVLDSLVVAQSQGAFGGTSHGLLIGGSSGTLMIGSQATPGNVYIAYSMAAAATNASVNLGGQDSLQAMVHDFWISNSDGNSAAAAGVTLAKANDIHADSIIVGNSGQDSVSFENLTTLKLGASNNLVAHEMLIGSGYSDTKVTIPAGGLVNIGSEDVRTEMTIGRTDVEDFIQSTHSVDLTGATFNAHLNDLTVGEIVTNPNPAVPLLTATLKGGNQGTITVGTPNALGVVAIGHINGSGSVRATVDFSGQTQFTAHLQTVDVGVSDSVGSTGYNASPTGTFILAQSNMIDAHLIRIGSSTDGGFGGGILQLGHSTTILADKMLVAVTGSTGTVQAAAGSTVVLGDASRRMELQVGIGLLGDFNYADGKVDLTGADVTAWLGNVTLGYAHDQNPQILVKGELSLGPLGHVNANNIMMADGATSWGELNLGGAQLIADQITHGAGKVEFSWTAGRLEVGQFGSEQFAFDLPNTGAGTLVTGHVPGTPLHVYGNYQQGAQANFEAHEHLGQIASTIVSGSATLDGTLSLILPDGFSPALGQQFTFLSASGINGQFAHVNGYYAGGDTVLLPVYQATSVLLQAYRAGDANLNGTVDGADYIVWADHFMTSTDTVATGDFNGDGFVDGADYVVWADHFAPFASPSVSAVPEPGTLSLFAMGLVCCTILAVRRRGSRLSRVD